MIGQRIKFTVAGNHEYKEINSIHYTTLVTENHSFMVTLFTVNH